MPSAENEPRSSAADLPIQHCRRITTRPTKRVAGPDGSHQIPTRAHPDRSRLGWV